jgi:hypothetical protein
VPDFVPTDRHDKGVCAARFQASILVRETRVLRPDRSRPLVRRGFGAAHWSRLAMKAPGRAWRLKRRFLAEKARRRKNI